MKTPSITPAQIGAIIGWLGAQAVAYGLLTSQREQLLLTVTSTVVAVAWKLADAYLRGQRVTLATNLSYQAHSAGLSGLSKKVAALEDALKVAEKAADEVSAVVPAPQPDPQA